jgi:hypothetical protein
MLYIDQIEALLALGFQLQEVVKERQPLEGKDLIAYAFLRKAMRILLSIRRLVHDGLEEEAQILCRALIETYINFDYFLKLAKVNFEDAFIRVMDSMMLEKRKALESARYRFGDHEVNKEEWDEIVAAIKSKYSRRDIKKMRKYGFSGISLEARARGTDNLDCYNLVYRLYSKHIHGTDLNEQLQEVLVPDYIPRYSGSRILSLLQASFTYSVRIVYRCNDWLGWPITLPVDIGIH